MKYEELIKKIKDVSDAKKKDKMARFGINTDNLLGVKVSDLRKIAKDIDKDHELATKLWDSGIHEARILASMVDEPDKVSEDQMEEWVEDFDSWDLCDQVCNNLFRKTEYAKDKTLEWSHRDEEFVKRAAFVLMAVMATHDKERDDNLFLEFLERCEEEADDERKYVKKAISWAVRNIGKRSGKMRKVAFNLAKELKEKDSKSARWVGKDILRKTGQNS